MDFIAGSPRSFVARWLPALCIGLLVGHAAGAGAVLARQGEWLAVSAILAALVAGGIGWAHARRLAQLAERERKARLVAHQPRQPSTGGWMRVDGFRRN